MELKENDTDDISTNKEEKDDNQDKKYFFKLKNYCNEFGNQMLLIIDNVDEPLSLNDENILFPNDPSSNFSILNLGCNILFTTRKDFELPGGVIQHALSILLPLPSYDLLTKYRKPSSIQEEECARNICNRVGYLPLALVLAQTFLKENFWTSFKDYDEELAKSMLNTIDMGRIPKEQLATQHIAAVGATFDQIWTMLDRNEHDQEQVQRNQNAKKLLYLLGLFVESAIVPQQRLSIYSGIAKFGKSKLIRPVEEAFLLLDKLNLIDILKDNKSVRTHPLLREYALEKLHQNEGYQENDLKLEACINLKKAYYDDFPSLVQEYVVERNSDIDSIIEDFRTVISWSKAIGHLSSKLTESDLTLIHQLNKIPEQESHNLRPAENELFGIDMDKSILFAQQIYIRSMDLNDNYISEKLREFLLKLWKPFLNFKWINVITLSCQLLVNNHCVLQLITNVIDYHKYIIQNIL